MVEDLRFDDAKTILRYAFNENNKAMYTPMYLTYITVHANSALTGLRSSVAGPLSNYISIPTRSISKTTECKASVKYKLDRVDTSFETNT